MTLELLAIWFVRLLALYAGLGLLFALAFVTRGIERIDPGAVGATWGFRLIVLPASIALWPLLLQRWFGGVTAPPVESNAHRRAAAVAGAASARSGSGRR
jgi:hypothetical protein